MNNAWILEGEHPGAELWKAGIRHTLQTAPHGTATPADAVRAWYGPAAGTMAWATSKGFRRSASKPVDTTATYFVNATARKYRDGLYGAIQVRHTDGRQGDAGQAAGKVASRRRASSLLEHAVTDGAVPLIEWLSGRGWTVED